MTAQDFVAQSCKTPWIITYTGKRVNPLDLREEDIDIRDIAHHLATINRWCGALHKPISVAQHSVHVSWLCKGTGYELEGLLHDASEAYLGEVTKWLKGSDSMTGYRVAENRAMLVISRRFDIGCCSVAVEEADKLMVGIEASFGIEGWTAMPGYEIPTQEEIKRAKFDRPWTWQRAENQFLERFADLTDGWTIPC